MALLIATLLALAGCATTAEVEADRQMSDAVAMSQEAMICRRSMAGDSRYQAVAVHMPLAEPYLTTVAQMGETRFATEEDIEALLAWSQDIRRCRQRAFAVILHHSPASMANVLTAWKDEDETFVLITKRKLSFGDAATRLRTIHADPLSRLTDQALEISAQLNNAKQAELSRRVSIFNALTDLAP